MVYMYIMTSINTLRHSYRKALKRLKSRKCSTGERVEYNGSLFDNNSKINQPIVIN